MKLSIISDTHNKHNQLVLPGGDVILHAGDMSSRGYDHEIDNFCKWFDKLPFSEKIFISGNHDFGFQDKPKEISEIVKSYENINYLQDDMYLIGDDYSKSIKIWGTPWQPWFYNWAFNAHRGEDIKQHWDIIPNDIDILITHGPPFGVLDKVIGRSENLGCEELIKKIKEIKPKIHVFGHIHSGHGYYFDGNTHYFNASVLNEEYNLDYGVFNIDWDPITNEVKFI
jgi:predicted phosphohydrolase